MRINVRTTVETYAALAAASTLSGLSLPRYLVESGLRDGAGGWSLREQRWWAERLNTVETRLVRVGTNLNQMAAAAHAAGVPHETVLRYALDYLTVTLEQHRAVLTAIDPADRSRRSGS
jgi:hypothetical protein